MRKPRADRSCVLSTWVVYLFALATASCSGDGCSCGDPIPGGFPPEERVENAVQVRLSQSGIETLEADPSALVEGLLGTGEDLTFDIPADCAGDPAICCTGGTPDDQCGPLQIDLQEYPGDEPRAEVNPIAGQDRVDVTIRARVRTVEDIPIVYMGADCTVAIDTTAGGSTDDLRLDLSAQFSQDADASTTRVAIQDVAISQIDNSDISIDGGFLCLVGDVLIGLFKGTLIDQIETTIQDAVGDALCKQCPSGTTDECGPFANACESNVCMKPSGECLQELGMSARLRATDLIAQFSPGTGGAIDIYDVAGGYATTEQDGLSLALLGGALPAGEERERCGPSADPPAAVSVPVSDFFQGNTRPDTSEPFDFALGMHQHNLDLFAYSAYQSGFLCLNVGTRSVDMLTTDTMIGLVMPSLADLMHGKIQPIVLGLRPQSPPAIVIGKGTYDGQGNIDDPLLDVTFDGLEVDFYAMVDDQYIRIMTLRADVELPLNLDVTAEGEILPVLGDLDNAFTNLEVTNSEALVETPEELENKFPALLEVALPFVTDALGSFALPEIGGLTLQLDEITSVDNQTFLAFFGSFAVSSATSQATHVDTEARLVEVTVPDAAVFSAPRLDRALRPSVQIELGGSCGNAQPCDLEWSLRVDRGLWTPYRPARQITLSRNAFWLQARHEIEVRARAVGEPSSADPTPAVLRPVIDRIPPHVALAYPTADAILITATDNVSSGALHARHRFPDTDWIESGALPARVELDGRDVADLQVVVEDEAGNRTAASPGSRVPWFHGTPPPSDSDCGECGLAGDGRGSSRGSLTLLFVIGLALARGTRRRGLAWLRRRARALVIWTALLLAGALPPAGCSCGGTEADDYLDGEVEHGPTGRYNSVAGDGERLVVSAYEETLGDLVLIDVGPEGERTETVVDGIPEGVPPAYAPDTYRGGVPGEGPNVGAWTSVELFQSMARIAYQDIDNHYLKFASEHADGWYRQVVDSDIGENGELGLHASLALDPSGVPAIAYLAVGVDGQQGAKLTQLRFARASNADPRAESDWTVEVLDEAIISCAGLCSGSTVCVAEESGQERCTTPTSDCATECGDSEACVSGTCLAEVPDPPTYDYPRGLGLFPNLLYLPSANPAVAYFDRQNGDLLMQVYNSSWSRIPIDAELPTDTGFFVSTVVDGQGTVHFAYQEALVDELRYTTWSAGGVGPVEIVDDGVRAGESRTHPVGWSSAIFIDSAGGIAIAHQDSLTSDLLLARRTGDGTWQREDLLTGPMLDGFYIDAVTAGGSTTITSYRYDHAFYPPGELVLSTIP